MKKINIPLLAIGLAALVAAVAPARAQSAGDIFKSRCSACHGADGTGSAIGKKMGAPDFTGADVQKMSDSELTDVISNGKNKMPAYRDKLMPDEIKGLVGYIRTLKK